jgi:tripartite-type tricarboxylate transporter receptor subunit TctC
MRCFVRASIAALVVALSAASAPAQTYPTKPIRIVVPVAPGGVTDVVARALAQRLGEAWGQQVIVENKPGADYQIGATFVTKAEPDGHTMLAIAEAFVINQVLHGKKLPYDVFKDFAAVTGLVSINHALITNPSLPVNNVAELIALAKRKPGELNYGTYGIGSTGHLNMEMFQSMTGTKLMPIHYRGASPALTDVIAGHIPMMFISVSSAVDTWRDGKLKMLGIGSAKRMAQLPEVPTIAETVPGFQALTWFGLFTTGGTPPAVVDKINREAARVFADAAFREKFLAPYMFEPITTSPAAFTEFLKGEADKWSKVIHDANFTMN